MTTTLEKKKIKLIYKELQGYLLQIPLPKNAMDLFYDKSGWEHINSAIDRLNAATGGNYDGFKTIQQHDSDGWTISVTLTAVRSKLAGLINVLHEEYFDNEPAPFSDNPGAPSTVIHNQNSQSQSQQQQQEQQIELEQLIQNALETIRAEYGKEQAEKAGDLIEQIIHNSKNWGEVAVAISGLLAIGKVAFTAVLPILGKILLVASPVLAA